MRASVQRVAHAYVQLRRLTEVVGERITSEEPYETVQLSDTVLERGARQTPSEGTLQFERRFRGISRPLLDVVSFIKLPEHQLADLTRSRDKNLR